MKVFCGTGNRLDFAMKEICRATNWRRGIGGAELAARNWRRGIGGAELAARNWRRGIGGDYLGYLNQAHKSELNKESLFNRLKLVNSHFQKSYLQF
jgi:hypothetical protein